MEWIGVIGIVAGLVFFVIAAMKGWNVLVTSLVTAGHQRHGHHERDGGI